MFGVVVQVGPSGSAWHAACWCKGWRCMLGCDGNLARLEGGSTGRCCMLLQQLFEQRQPNVGMDLPVRSFLVL